jgi:hypothetical protein
VVLGVRGVGGGGGRGTESTRGRTENKTATGFLGPTICSGTWEDRGRKNEKNQTRRRSAPLEGRLGYGIVIPYPEHRI